MLILYFKANVKVIKANIMVQSITQAKIRRLSFLDTYTMRMNIVEQILWFSSNHLFRSDMER